MPSNHRKRTNFFKPVLILPSDVDIVTKVLFDFTLDVIATAPVCALKPKIESPT